MNCNECKKELLDNSKFCRFCGVKQSVGSNSISDIPKPYANACKKCGNSLFANAKFCKSCGEPSHEITSSSTHTTNALPTTETVTTSEIIQQDKISFNESPINSSPEQKAQKNRNWLIPSLVLLAIFIVLTLIYVLKFSDESNLNQPEVAKPQIESASIAVKATNESPQKVESELIVFANDEVGIPFSDGVDENAQPNAEAKDFEKNWKGKRVSLKYGGVKVSYDFAVCRPNIEGLNPNSIVTGVLVDRPLGGSGGNPIFLKDCNVEKPNENSVAKAATPAVKAMLDEYSEINSKCRGGAGDDSNTQLACNKRDTLHEKLNSSGWCFGEEGQAGFEMVWHQCNKFSLGQHQPLTNNLPVQRPLWCEKAETNVEKMICSDDTLSEKDVSLYEVYKKARALALDKIDFNNKGSYWFRNVRNACTTKDCLMQAYEERSAELMSEINSAENNIISN